MSVAAAVPEGEWYNEFMTTGLSASMKNDALFRKLSQRLYKDNAVDNLKDQMNATLVRMDAHRFDVDLNSLTSHSARTLVRVDAHRFKGDVDSASSHSPRIRVERTTTTYPDSEFEIDTSDSEDSSRGSDFSGDGTVDDIDAAEMSQSSSGGVESELSTIEGGKKRTRKGFFRFKSRVRRAKKHLAAAGGAIAEAGHKMLGHQKHPPASEGVWMVNNPVYEFERDMFEFAMGPQLKKRDAWSHLRYNSLN
ncbi:hypothetical protein BSKO_13345 [Bryopsis sp. KO-2023]|nr:hypothetical protein BSKO_13345 [Bryopsis sp. KO-2023]